jgi:NAD dependent epimerase/dehydratase
MKWDGKRVLVTGGAGFIGSHLVEELVSRGANVRALVHYNALKNAGWLDTTDLDKKVELVFGDVGDSDSVAQAMEGCDIVFHLAALIGIPYSYVAPRAYVRTNVEGTLNVLQAARRLETPRVLVTSTSEVYGSAQYAPMDELHPLVGQSPYSATKIGADQLARSFHLSFETPVTIVRPFNTYGPRQSTRAVIPTIITQAMSGGPLKLGNLDATRDLNYVLDTANAFIRCAEEDASIGKTIHFGTGTETSIRGLAEIVCRLLGRECNIEVESERLRPTGSEVTRLIADATLARTLLGWSPRFSIEQGLERTVEWFGTARERYTSLDYAV